MSAQLVSFWSKEGLFIILGFIAVHRGVVVTFSLETEGRSFANVYFEKIEVYISFAIFKINDQFIKMKVDKLLKFIKSLNQDNNQLKSLFLCCWNRNYWGPGSYTFCAWPRMRAFHLINFFLYIWKKKINIKLH